MQKTTSAKERIHLLYLLKNKQAQTVQAAASILGRHRATLHEWLKQYRKGGVEALLKSRPRSGRPRAIPQWAVAALQQRLEEPQGFDGYQAICDGLETQLCIVAEYKTVHHLVHYRLHSSAKVPRPVSIKQSAEQLEAYKKT